MAANLPKTNQPRWFCGISFTDPNDPSVVEMWRDFTTVLRGVANLTRGGAVYELGQAVAGQPKFYLRDVNEDLNPDNPSSPYAGNILPYRPICWLGTWPQVAGNLLNSGAWRVPFDPGFEASTVGAHPDWITPLGGTAPVVGITTPHGGSRDLTWTTVATATIQGVAIGPAYTMPGTQYTVSAYVRQSTASTQAIAVGDLTAGVDYFNRVTANGWGTADIGGAWTNTGGAAGDYATVPGVLSAQGAATHTLTSVNVARMTTVGANVVDFDATVFVGVPVLAAGAAIRAGVVGRWTAASDLYRASVDFNTDQTMTLVIWKRIAGIETNLGSTTLPFLYTPGASFGLRFRAVGTTLEARCWRSGTARPTIANITLTNESSITAAGQVGCWSRLETGNTNGTIATTYRTFNATGTVLGTSTVATGAYNRVTATFVATDIQHTIYVRTTGTALAGTVLLDDIQLEEGAAASAWTSTGPVVYPVFNGLCERFERAWPSSGFEGEALVTCVDKLAALNAISLPTEYVAAVLATNPDYYWSLAGANLAAFPDVSGNAGPSMTVVASKSGAGNAPSPGANANIVGDSGGTGVQINGAFPVGSALQAGSAHSSAFRVAASAPPWALSASFWFTADNTNAGFLLTIFNYVNAINQPIALYISQGPSTTQAEIGVSGAGGAIDLQDVTSNLFDGHPHLVVGTVNFPSTTVCTYSLYVDGVQLVSHTFNPTTVFGAGNLNMASPIVQVGADMSPAFPDFNGQDGTYSHVALWNRILSSGEVTNLWNAGGLGFSGETSSTRWERHLSLGGYAGPSRLLAGSSIMGPPSYQGLIRLLADAQNTVVAEGGCMWAAQDGAVVFEGRQARWLRLAPVATFGENASGGEIVYEPDFSLSQDPQYIFADVQITQSNGPTAVGGRTADITTAAKRFFGKPYAATVDLLNVADVQSLADWTFYTHNRPLTRAAVVHITPARGVGTAPTAPGSWAQALSLEIGQRVRATRRAKAGNSGAGITITLDYFIEAVTFDNFDADSGEFDAYFLLSPIGSATVGTGVTFQPWILGDATYGVLGSTTVLGW